MAHKISLRVAGRPFDVDVSEPFLTFLKQQMEKDFHVDGNNEVKTLLQAYVRQNHALFLQEEKMKSMMRKIEQQNEN